MPVTPNNPCLTCTKDCTEKGKDKPKYLCVDQELAGLTAAYELGEYAVTYEELIALRKASENKQ